MPSGVVPTNVLNHLNDLGNIQKDIAKNAMLFEQKMNVTSATKNAGSVAGMHLADLYKMQNNMVTQQALKTTTLEKSLQSAIDQAKKKDAELAQKAKDNASADAARAAQAKKEADAKAAAAKKKAAEDLKKFGGNAIAASQFANWPSGKSSGGLIKRFAVGGPVIGTDVVPSMLTPGEFIMSKYAVDTYGVDKMRAINNGDASDASVYNYSIAVNVKSDANPDEIARAVMGQIRQVDSKRLRSRAI